MEYEKKSFIALKADYEDGKIGENKYTV